MILPIRELLAGERRADVITFRARLQIAVETASGSRVAEAPPGVGAFRFRITSYLNAWEQ